MATQSHYIMPPTLSTAPENEFDFAFCRDFVWQHFERIRLQGRVSEISSLLSRVNQDFVVRAASNQDHLSALHALTMSLETTLQAIPVAFDDLLNMLRSGAFRDLAQTTVRSAPISGNQRSDLFERLTAGKDLPLTAILILLNLLGKFSGKIYEIGVLSFKGTIEGIPTFRVQLHAANPDKLPTQTVWIAKDCQCTDGNASGTQWSGIAPIPLERAVPSPGSLTTAGGRDSLPTFDLDLSIDDVERVKSFDTDFFSTTFDEQDGTGFCDDNDPDGQRSSYKHGSRWRRVTPGAPMRNTELPVDLLSDITLEELMIYYPEHTFHWPGLALLALHTSVRSKVKGDTGFKAIANLVNSSRGLRNLEEDPRYPVTRITVRGWLVDAAKIILGPDYSTKESDHLRTLYAAVARDPTVQNVAEFLQKHLWDLPPEEEVEGLFPQEPLLRVGQNVINHPEQGAFKDRVLCTLTGIPFVPPPFPAHFHPMVLKLNDFSRSEADVRISSASGLAKPLPNTLSHDCYPTDISQDDMIEKCWPDLYGEPLLWTLLQYSMADIAKRVSDEAYRTYSKTRTQFEATLRQRKRTALKDRAKRLGRPLKEILSEYETETTEYGTRRGRRDRLPNGIRAREIEARKKQKEDEEPLQQFKHVPKRSRKRVPDLDDLEARKRGRARRSSHGRLPSLPALSPPLPGEGWEFPPESEFRMKSKPGRFVAVAKRMPAEAQPQGTHGAEVMPTEQLGQEEGTAGPEMTGLPEGARMRFSFSYQPVEDEDGDIDAHGELDDEFTLATLSGWAHGDGN